MRRSAGRCGITACKPARAHVRAQAEPPANLCVGSFYLREIASDALSLGTTSEIKPPVPQPTLLRVGK